MAIEGSGEAPSFLCFASAVPLPENKKYYASSRSVNCDLGGDTSILQLSLVSSNEYGESPHTEQKRESNFHY